MAGISSRAALRLARGHLRRRGVEDPMRESLLALSDSLGSSFHKVVEAGDRRLSRREEDAFRLRVGLRGRRVPLAYIRGHKEFWSRPFLVSPSCLIPRPETELLVEVVLTRRDKLPARPRVLDLGTGSGTLAVTLALEMPEATLLASDISARALRMAAANARLHGVSSRVSFLECSMFENLEPQSLDLVVCNPPYVPAEELSRLEPEVRRWEPHQALAGGKDGLFFVRRLLRLAPVYLRPGGMVVLEVGAGQRAQVDAFAARTGAYSACSWIPDLAGIDRVLALGRER